MAGRSRLANGAPRKASQRHARHAVVSPQRIAAPAWRPGDKVRWREHLAYYLQLDENDAGMVKLLIGQRTYRVPLTELRPA